ncbi:MAG: hypothetical protein ABW223_12850 [Rariglobus sp.]
MKTPRVVTAQPVVDSDLVIVRLEREKADLVEDLKEAMAMLAEREVTLATARESLEELRRPMTADIISSALRAELKSGEVVVTGGHLLPDGRRLYAFARPVIERGTSGDEVAVSGRFLSLDEAAGKSAGLENLNTNAANTLQHGEVWIADEEVEVLGKLAAVPGTQIIETPTVRVKPGASGMIEVGDLKLKVTPVAMRGENMDFEIRLERPLVPPNPASPADSAALNIEGATEASVK